MFPAIRNNSMSVPTTAGPVNRLETLFDRVFGEEGGLPSQAWAGMPMVMWQDEDHFYLEVEMPGVAEQDLDLNIHRGTLTIRGERKPAEGRSYLYNTRSYGRFQQVIGLPEAVDAEAVQAKLKDGVLSIDLPKSPEAKPRKISLRAS